MVVIGHEIDIEIDTKSVCSYLGYGADSKPQARISSLIEEYAEEARQLIMPSFSYVIRDIELVQDSLVFVEGSDDLLSRLIVFESKVIARLLSQCRKVAVFLVTAGSHLEEMACRLAEDGLVLQASVLDAIGSDAVEKVADFVQDRIGKTAQAEGLVAGRRFSPGYCDWDISQQRAVFRAVNGDSVGVQLTDRCLMIPQKSVSGIIGLGPPEGNLEDYNPCKTCDKRDCRGRR